MKEEKPKNLPVPAADNLPASVERAKSLIALTDRALRRNMAADAEYKKRPDHKAPSKTNYYFNSPHLSAALRNNGKCFGAVRTSVNTDNKFPVVNVLFNDKHFSAHGIKYGSGYVFTPAFFDGKKLTELSGDQKKFIMFVSGEILLQARDKILSLFANLEIPVKFCPHCGEILDE